MTDKVQKIKDWISNEQEGLMDANGNFEYPEHEGAYHILCNLDAYIDSLQEEPVSGLDNGDMPIERWKQAVKAASNQRNYRSSKGLTETRDDYFVDGVQWGDEHPKEEPVSEDLEKEMDNYLPTVFSKDMDNGEPRFTTWFKALRKTAHHFAEWQKEQMMTKAIDVEVRVDAGGYPYIDKTIELYDYDKDAPLAKKGDRYKVILIKEG